MNNRFSKIFPILIPVLFFLLSGINFAQADFNKQINYQGKLTSSSSIPVADGGHCLRFSIQTDATASSSIWTEEWKASTSYATTTSGLFSAMLGTHSSLSDVNFNQTLYLQVDYDPGCDNVYEEEFSPRKILGAVPAAFEAAKLGGYTWASPGAIGLTTASSGAFTTLTVSASSTLGDVISGNWLGSAIGDGYISSASTWHAKVATTTPFSAGYIPYATSSSAITNSNIFQLGSNIGIGTSTPSSLLDVAGAVQLRGFATSTTGLYVNGSGNVGIGTTSPKGKLDVAGGISAGSYAGANTPPSNGMIISGNVGIGTTTPGEKLTVAGGNISLTTANPIITGQTGLTLQETGDTYGTVKLCLQNRYGVNGAMFEQAGSVDLVDFVFKSLSHRRNIRFEDRANKIFAGDPEFQIGVADNPTLVIGDNVSAFRKGNVGIGTTGPGSKLSVSGGATFGSGYTASALADGNVAISGNLGIGTTTPSEVLTVNGGLWVGTSTVGIPTLYVASTTGRVGIGTSTPAYALQIAGDIVPTENSLYSLGTSTLKWANLYAATTTVGDLVFANEFRITEADASSTPQVLIFKNQKGEEIMRLDENGNLTIGGKLIEISSSAENEMNSLASLARDIGSLVKDTLQSLGLAIENGVARLKELITEKLTTKTARIEKLEMVDKDTGDIYEFVVEKGILRVARIFTDRLTAKELCVEDVCVTREQFLQIVQGLDVSVTVTPPLDESEPESKPELVVEPTQEPAVEELVIEQSPAEQPEPAEPELAPEPEPEPEE